MNAFTTTNRDNIGETNGLVNPAEFHENFKNVRSVPWSEKGLQIVRLRLLSDPGFPMFDVSYCKGYIGDEPVNVQLPFSQLPKRGLRTAIVVEAKRDGVFAKGTGIFNAISTLC